METLIDKQTKPARTMLVDDHPLFRMGLVTLFGGEAGVTCVGEAASATEALKIAGESGLDVALIDMMMPGGEDGVALAKRLRTLQPDCKIIGLSMVDEPAKIAQLFLAGASGYVLKTQPLEELVEAIRTVLGGARYLPPQISADRVDGMIESPRSPLERLTVREREIIQHLVEGQSNGQIAAQLFISERTVETHRQRILRKLGAHSIVEVIAIASRCGMSVLRD